MGSLLFNIFMCDLFLIMKNKYVLVAQIKIHPSCLEVIQKILQKLLRKLTKVS